MAEVRSGSFKTSIFSGAETSPSHYVFSWTLTSQSIENNTSTISWTLSAAGGLNEYYWIYIYDKYVTVNGVTKSSTAGVQSYNGTVAFSGTSTITHSGDGKGKFSASAGGAFYYSGSYNSTGSGSWDLPTIARATTPTLSATTITMGSSITVSMSPANSTFKHKLRYDFGSVSGSATGFSIGEGFTVQGNSSATFTPPTSLGSQIPSAMSGKGTLYCYTYASNGTHIGTKSVGITLNVPAYTPEITGITLSGNNLLGGAYVQGKSTATGDASVKTYYGAQIKSISSVIDGKTYTSLPFTTSALSTGNKSAAITFTDSRNKSVTVSSAAITVYAYSIPSISVFKLERQSNGTTVIATVQGTIASVNSKNAKTIKVTLNGVTNTITSSSYTISATTTFTNVPTDNTLNATASFADSYTTVTKSATLPTVAVTMDFHNSGKGIAMGKVAETAELLDVAWDTRVGKNLQVDGTINGVDIRANNYVLGGSREGITDENWIANAPSFIGTYSQDNQWYSTLSLRHRNGQDDGSKYGLQLRSILVQDDNLSWRQHINGSWKTWRTLLDSINTADYIVQQGTSGNWTYRKWNSGVAECFIRHTFTPYATGDNDVTISYPFTFTTTPVVTPALELNGTIATGGVIACNGAGNTPNNTTQCNLCVCGITTKTYNIVVDVRVIGKWK